MSELYEQTACEVLAQLKSGTVSIQETLDALQHRIGAVDAEMF